MASTSSLLQALLQSIENGESVALVTVVKASGAYQSAIGSRALVWPHKEPLGSLALGLLNNSAMMAAHLVLDQRHPKTVEIGDDKGKATIFIEVQRRPPTLIIVGAGHIALPLAQLGKLIEFEVIVMDDRPQYANKGRFPIADKVLAAELSQALRNWPIDHDTYIVLVTRGHSYDVECLLEIIDSPARYIGMIGSKRRVRAVFELLEKERGIEKSKFERIYAPIGLDLGAESPAEIGVAIIGEIIKIYRGGRADSLSDTLHANRRLPLHPGRVGSPS